MEAPLARPVKRQRVSVIVDHTLEAVAVPAQNLATLYRLQMPTNTSRLMVHVGSMHRCRQSEVSTKPTYLLRATRWSQWRLTL